MPCLDHRLRRSLCDVSQCRVGNLGDREGDEILTNNSLAVESDLVGHTSIPVATRTCGIYEKVEVERIELSLLEWKSPQNRLV